LTLIKLEFTIIIYCNKLLVYYSRGSSPFYNKAVLIYRSRNYFQFSLYLLTSPIVSFITWKHESNIASLSDFPFEFYLGRFRSSDNSLIVFSLLICLSSVGAITLVEWEGVFEKCYFEWLIWEILLFWRW